MNRKQNLKKLSERILDRCTLSPEDRKRTRRMFGSLAEMLQYAEERKSKCATAADRDSCDELRKAVRDTAATLAICLSSGRPVCLTDGETGKTRLMLYDTPIEKEISELLGIMS